MLYHLNHGFASQPFINRPNIIPFSSLEIINNAHAIRLGFTNMTPNKKDHGRRTLLTGESVFANVLPDVYSG